MTLRNLIRRYRFDDGEMTQQQLADLCGVSRQTINPIERNKYPPPLDLAFRIVRVFGASIEDVFLYEGDAGGENSSQDSLTIHVICADSSRGTLDSEGEEL